MTAFAEENFAQKDYFQALEEIARTGKFHIFTDVPNSAIAAFSYPESMPPAELLSRLAKAMGHQAWKVGNSFLLITREQYLKREGLHISFLQPAERLAESVLTSSPADFPRDVTPFVIPEANLIALSGYPDELVLAQKAIEKWDTPQKNLAMSLNISTLQSPAAISSFSFSAMEGVPIATGFLFSAPEQPVSATFSVKLQGASSLHLQASSTDFNALGSWTATVIPDRLRTIASLTPTPKRSPNLSTNLSESPENPMNLRWIDKPLIQALQEAMGSEEQGNLVCSTYCSGTISLFGYGNDLYYEEFINLIAKTKNLAVRKIGNTWMIAEEGQIQDTFDRSLFIARRLQNTSAKFARTNLESMFTSFSMLPSVELSFDSCNNLVLVGGKSLAIDAGKRLLEILDRPLPHLSLSIQFSQGKEILRETLQTPLGKTLVREMQTPAGTATIELLPVLLGNRGNIALRWSLKQTTSHDPLYFRGWTILNKQAEPKLLHFQAAQPVSLSVYGDISWVPPEEHSEDDMHTDGGDAFDDAFDSSF